MKQLWKRIVSLALGLTLCLGLLSSMAFTTEAASTTTNVQLTVTYDQTGEQTGAQAMLDMINDFRTGEEAYYLNSDNETTTTCENLEKLTYDYTLEAIAMQRAVEIALSYSHTRPNGETCFTAYDENEQGTTFSSCAENIAAGHCTKLSTTEQAFVLWREDEKEYEDQGHRRNMLSSKYTAVGIAHVTYGDYEYWVQEFGTPSTSNGTATTNVDGEKTVTIEVLNSKVSSVTLTADTASYDLSCGGSVTLPELMATLIMDATWPSTATRTVTVDSPTWTSSDTSVATVDDEGKVTAVSVGLTTITASALGTEFDVTVDVSHGETETQNAVAATCTKEGYTGDKVCTDCGEIVEAGETIDATGHGTTEPQNYKGATCTEEGYTGDEVCTVCGEIVEAGETIPATGHGATTNLNAKAATCTVDGYSGDEICTYCGAIVKSGETITATGHTTEIQNAKAATCTEEGYSGDEVCTVCGATVTAGSTIQTTEHTAGEAVVENKKLVSCTEGGSYDSVVYCTVCGYEISRENVEIEAATGHIVSDGTL